MIASAFFMLTVLRHLDVTKEHLIRVVNVSNQVCFVILQSWLMKVSFMMEVVFVVFLCR